MSNTWTDKQLAQALAAVPLFAGLSAKQRRSLAIMGKTQTWKSGRTGIEQGSKGAGFFMILEGGVTIGRDGNDVAQLGPSDFFGEIALLTGDPRNASATASQDSQLFVLAKPAFAAAVKADPSVAIKVLEAMARRQQV